MAEFTLDTSGAVELADFVRGGNTSWSPGKVAFSGLGPFTQGYIEALFSTSCYLEGGHAYLERIHADWPEGAQTERALVGFDSLAPETLAAILKDCAEACTAGPGVVYDNSDKGREFWEERQRGDYSITLYPPLTPYLGDDGKIYLREAP